MKVWTPDDVKFELSRAYRVLFSLPVHDNFNQSGRGYWPHHTYEADEIKEQQDVEKTENRPLRARQSFSPRDIRRAETILLGDGRVKGWLVEFLDGNPAMKRCLARWAIWHAQDRNVKFECKVKGWAYSTFRRRRDQGAQALAEALNQAGIELA